MCKTSVRLIALNKIAIFVSGVVVSENVTVNDLAHRSFRLARY